MRKRLTVYCDDKQLVSLLPIILASGADFQVTDAKVEPKTREPAEPARQQPAAAPAQAAVKAPEKEQPRPDTPIVGRPINLRTWVLAQMKAPDNSAGIFKLADNNDRVRRWGYQKQTLYQSCQRLVADKLAERVVAGIYRITPAGRGYVNLDGKVDVKSLPKDLIGSGVKTTRRIVKRDPSGRSSRELLMYEASKHPPGEWFRRGELTSLSVKSGFSPITLSVKIWELTNEGKLERKGKFFVRVPPLKESRLPEVLEPARAE